jgi:septal ring factor EnvC (AmiA/AmiB activator)
MVQDRKEPTFSTASSEASNKNRPSANSSLKNPNAATKRVAPSPSADTRAQVMIQKQPSSLLWLALFIALATSAACGYLLWQFNSAQQVIAQQQVRLVGLENKLLLSDDESTQSLTVLTSNVKSLDKNVSIAMSEVDKLWATRNANLDKLAAAKAEVDKRIDVTSQQSGRAVEGLDKQLKQSLVIAKQSSAEQELLIRSLRERVAEQNRALGNVQSVLKNNSSSAEKLSAVTQNITQLEQKLSMFLRRTQEYDEAIESFDKFRLITNRDLINLKTRAGIAPQ